MSRTTQLPGPVKLFWMFVLAFSMSFASSLSFAEATAIKIQVRGDDSKFIGSGVGGMNVLIKEAQTGALLAQGQITGETGDTETLMKTGQTRGHSSTLGNPASFSTELDLDQPTRIEISVTGPLDVPQSIQTVSTSLWLVPGMDMVDPGVTLLMPGLIVDLLESNIKGETLELTASVTMICGCPITRGGLWDADDFITRVQLFRDGKQVSEVPLAFTGTTNQFSGKLSAPDSGEFSLVISAYQKSRGNTGVYQRDLVFD